MPELESHSLLMALPFNGTNELAVEPFLSETFVARGLRALTASTYGGVLLSGEGDGAWDGGFPVSGGRHRGEGGLTDGVMFCPVAFRHLSRTGRQMDG